MTELAVVNKTLLLEQNSNALLVGTASVVGPGVLGKHFVTKQELVISLSVDEASTSNANVLEQSQVSNLVLDPDVIKYCRGLQVVGLDASNVEGLLRQKRGDQI